MQEFARELMSPIVVAALISSVVTVGMPGLTYAAQLRSPSPTMVRMMVAPDEVPPPTRVGLRIDTEDLGAGAEPLQAKIEETAAALFEAEGVDGARDDQDPQIVVVVERTGTEENPGFVVGFSIEQGDEIVSGSSRQADCSLCTRTELIDRIKGELPALLELAKEHQVQEAVAEDEGGEAGEDEGGVDPAGDKKIGALGFAGIGLGVLGLGGVGAGVGLAVQGVVPVEDQKSVVTNYRKPGNVVLAIGGAALIAGIVMIAVDVSKRKKARAKSQSGSKLRVQPYGAGIAF